MTLPELPATPQTLPAISLSTLECVIADLAPTIRLSTDSLGSKWGFEDGDLLNALVNDLDLLGTFAPASPPRPHDVLIHLVHALLVLPLVDEGYTITTDYWDTAHNPIRASASNGLYDASIREHIATATPTDLAHAVLAAYGDLPEPLSPPTPSAIVDGFDALVHRFVEVHLGLGEENLLTGRLLAVTDRFLTLQLGYDADADAGVGLSVIPRDKVLAITTYQLSLSEAEVIYALEH